MTSWVHLVKRALSSLSNKRPDDDGIARSIVNSEELTLWRSMQGRDQTHSLQVLSRFVILCPDATRVEKAAALLHDVGKTKSDLGWVLRIVATLVGSRGTRMAEYHAHERIGAQMLMPISDPRTIELVGGDVDDCVSRCLREADDI